jgi:hypothetical protein
MDAEEYVRLIMNRKHGEGLKNLVLKYHIIKDAYIYIYLKVCLKCSRS